MNLNLYELIQEKEERQREADETLLGAVPQEWNSDVPVVQRACSENAELLQRATSCMCASVSLRV